MLLWKFLVYVTADHKPKVQSEINRFDDYGSEDFRGAINHLKDAPRNEWKRPHARKLRGGHDIYEIRFKSNRVQTRALGFFGPEEGQFTITAIAAKKQNVYDPPNAIETAESRRKAILNGTAFVANLQIFGEDFPPVPRQTSGTAGVR